MRLVDETGASIPELALRAELPRLDDRPIEFERLERIVEPKLQLLEDIGSRIKRNRSFDRLRHGPELIDAVAMVAMRVRHDHAIQAPDVSR
jgi:hypothetical protein